MNGARTIETTLGDLIVALMEETVPVVSDKRTSCKVVSCILTDLFRTKQAIFKDRDGRDGKNNGGASWLGLNRRSAGDRT